MAEMLPPDGVPWPPEPPDPAPQAADAIGRIGAAPPSGRVEQMEDWRSMPVSDPPSGYRGSPTAPPAPVRRVNPWSIAAAAMVVAFPVLFLAPQLAFVMVPLAAAFGLAGHRQSRVAPELHRLVWLGAAATAAALVVAGVLAVLVTRGFNFE